MWGTLTIGRFTVFKNDNGELGLQLSQKRSPGQGTNFDFETSLSGRPLQIWSSKDFSGKPSDNF